MSSSIADTVGGSPVAKKNGAPFLRFHFIVSLRKPSGDVARLRRALDADDHGAERDSRDDAGSRAPRRRGEGPPARARRGRAAEWTCCMAVEPQNASVVMSQPLTAVAAIAASRTTIIAPPAGLWPMYRRSDAAPDRPEIGDHRFRRPHELGKARIARADEAPDDAKQHEAAGDIAGRVVHALSDVLGASPTRPRSSRPAPNGRPGRKDPRRGSRRRSVREAQFSPASALSSFSSVSALKAMLARLPSLSVA